MRLMAATAVLLLFGSTAAVAQEPQKPSPAQRFADTRERLTREATAQLQSEDLREIAWGAHTAAEFRLTGCIRALRAQLTSLAKLAPTAREFEALAVLDALIQTKAEVPADEVKPFAKGLTTESALVLLLPRAEDHVDVFFDVYRESRPGGAVWRACGNVLAKAKHPDFVLALLREPMPVSLQVFDHGKIDAEMLPAVSVAGHGELVPPKGYRTSAQYNVETRARYVSNRTSFGMTWNSRADRTRWMRAMLGSSVDEGSVDLVPNVNVEWTSIEQLEAFEQQQKEPLIAKLRALIAICVKQKLVTEQAAAALQPDVKFWWFDCRIEPKDPLPPARTWPGI